MDISRIFKSERIHRVSLHSFCKTVSVKDQVETIEKLINDNVIESYGICNFEPDELKYTTYNVIGETCYGANDGQIWVNVTGGTGNYYYDSF